MSSASSRSEASDWIVVATFWGAVLAVVPVLARTPHALSMSWPLVAHASGMLAGYAVIVLVAMMSRAPILERDIGADRLSRWHARGGRTILALTLIHATAATVSWAHAQRINLTRSALEVLEMPGIAAATVATLMMLTIAYLSARSHRDKLSYEQWHALHLTLYIAVGLTFSHQLAGPDLAGDRPAQIAWSLLYAGAYGLALRYRFLAPVMQMARHRLKVHTLIPEAPGVVSIVLRGRHLHELAAEPGQFFRWRFLTQDTWMSAHPFSLSALPTDTTLRITVKALGPGSRRLHGIRPGTWVLAEGPYGAMTAQRRCMPDVLLIAGGVGITPMRALLEGTSDPGHATTLIYRASSAADIIFRDELDTIAETLNVTVIYLIGPSSDPANSLDAEALHRIVPHLADCDVYLCASPRMTTAVRAALRDAGLPRHQLHHEEFTF